MFLSYPKFETVLRNFRYYFVKAQLETPEFIEGQQSHANFEIALSEFCYTQYSNPYQTKHCLYICYFMFIAYLNPT